MAELTLVAEKADAVLVGPAQEWVTQGQLKIIEYDRKRIKGAAEKLKREEKALAIKEAEIIASLRRGIPVEPGPLAASLKEDHKTSVAWKKVVERLKGKGYVARVLKNTKTQIIWRLKVDPNIKFVRVSSKRPA